MQLKLQSTQRIVDENNRIVIAEGRMILLEQIVATGSINQAAKKMRMSYKSAWSKIRSTEKHLETKIVVSDRSRGTRLTPAGQDLLQKYRLLKQRCLAADDNVFQQIFDPPISADSGGEDSMPPVVSFVGHSGSGKTTFVEKLIRVLTRSGVRLAVIKHDVHGFQMDRPGKDSYRHKQAGAVATMVSSPKQIGMVMDADYDHTPDELVPMLTFADLIITEGYKRGPYPKVEVFRPEATGDRHPLCHGDSRLIALISDAPLEETVPVFGAGDIERVADFLMRHFDLPAAG